MQKTIITVIALCLLNAGQAVFANPAPEDIINADINGDNKVDFQDYAAVVENWEITDCNDSNNWCECTDINHSGFVGLDDIQIMAESWLEGVDYVQTDVAFVTIPAGTFQMGDSFSDDGINGLPVHTVDLPHFFGPVFMRVFPSS